MDMDLKDYDSRTALHIAAAEGELHMFISTAVLIMHLMNEQQSKSVSQVDFKAVWQQICMTTGQK